MLSNIKYTAIYIYNMAKQFTLHLAEACPEPFPASKQGGYLIRGNYFDKNLDLRYVWKGSELNTLLPSKP